MNVQRVNKQFGWFFINILGIGPYELKKKKLVRVFEDWNHDLSVDGFMPLYVSQFSYKIVLRLQPRFSRFSA